MATGRAGRAIRVGADPVAAAITPDGRTLYVLNRGAGTVTPVAISTGRAGKAVTVGGLPDAIVITR